MPNYDRVKEFFGISDAYLNKLGKKDAAALLKALQEQFELDKDTVYLTTKSNESNLDTRVEDSAPSSVRISPCKNFLYGKPVYNPVDRVDTLRVNT